MGQNPLILKGLGDLIVLRRSFVNGRVPLAVIPRAPLLDPQPVLNALRQEGLHRAPVLISPDHPAPALAELGPAPLFTPAHLAILDLDAPLTVLRQNLHQKWRNRLRHGESQNLTLRSENLLPDPDHWLLCAERAQRKNRRYAAWPVALNTAYAQANPGSARLFTAHWDGRAIAGILVLIHGKSATYQIGHTTPDGKLTSAHNNMIWRVIKELHASGITQFDLETVDTIHARGLARFKLGTGAALHRSGSTWLWWPLLAPALNVLAQLDRAQMSHP